MNDHIESNPLVAPILGAVDYKSDSRDRADADWRRWLPSIAAALFGITIIAAVGFAPGIAHQVMHDVRHTMVFPCH